MKKMMNLLMAAALAFGLTGCGLFSTGDQAEKQAASDTVTEEASTTLAITDSYTHEDPADLEFDSRYALTTGKEAPELVEGFKSEYGVNFVEQIAIIYVDKEDKVVGEYDYYVFENADDAKTFGEIVDTESRGGVIEDRVVSEFMDEEMVNMLIDMDVQYGSMSEATGTAYIEFMKDVNVMMNFQ